MIHEQIQNEIKKAMKEKDAVRLNALRGLLTAFTNELVLLKRKPNEVLEDTLAQKVIVRETKKRKDSIEQFQKGGRQDLVDAELAELAHLEKFLPQQMSEDEIRTLVLAKKGEFGAIDKSKIGMFIGAVMKEIAGRADGALVKKIVEESLS